MFRLFLDHSGDIYYPKGMAKAGHAASHRGSTTHLTLAGVRFTDTQLAAWETSVDEILSNWFPDLDHEDIEIHLVRMVGRWKDWPWTTLEGRDIPVVIDEIRGALLASGAKAYGHVFDKVAYWNHFHQIVPEDPGPNAIRHLLKRADREMQQKEATFEVIQDEDSDPVKRAYAQAIRNVKANGDSLDPFTPDISNLSMMSQHRWADSQAERGLQAADYVAYWTQKAVEHGATNRVRELDHMWRRPYGNVREPWVFPMHIPALASLKGPHTRAKYLGPNHGPTKA